MNQDAATKIALDALEEEGRGARPLALFGPVVETDRAWIFSYQSARWVESHGREEELIGAGPLYVNKRTGKAHFLGTYSRRANVIRDFERYLDEQAE